MQLPGPPKEEKKEKKAPAVAKQVRKRRRKGPATVARIPQGKPIYTVRKISYFSNSSKLFLNLVFPTSKCKLRLLKLERIKDFLLMEEEFIRNQELRKPREEQDEVNF